MLYCIILFMNKTMQDLIASGLDVLRIEAKAVSDLTKKLNESFALACKYIVSCNGRIVVTGMGKSGHIGKKIAATLASTGSPAFFMHPAEASHGDLGMLTEQDIVLALSNSGETNEILQIVPQVKRMGIVLIAMTGNPASKLAQVATVHVDVGVEKEACILGLAPTASTTAALAMGDALAISVLKARGFTPEDFARSHPGGKLGKSLLLKVADIMHKEEQIPKVIENMTLAQAIVEMSKKRLGMTTVVDEKNIDKIIGIFTDGDLRRTLDHSLDIHNTLIKDVMTKKFRTIRENALAVEAISLMEKFKIFMLPVTNEQDQLVGAFNMHDLLQAGIV